jgi:hypothetical protein
MEVQGTLHGNGRAPGRLHPDTTTSQPGHESHIEARQIARGQSCMLCHRRKTKCDKKKPCSTCTKLGAECVVAPMMPPKRRRKKTSERELVDRLRRCEALLKKNGIAVQPVAGLSDLEAVLEGVEEEQRDMPGSLAGHATSDTVSLN